MNFLTVTTPTFFRGVELLLPGHGRAEWGDWNPHYSQGMMGWAGHAVGISLLFVLVVAVIYIARSLGRLAASQRKREETPLDILKKRYARGEINKEEYDGIKKDLVAKEL